MNKLYRHMRKSNYDKYPSTKICGTIFRDGIVYAMFWQID